MIIQVEDFYNTKKWLSKNYVYTNDTEFLYYVRDCLTLLNTKKGYQSQTLKTEKKKLNVLKELNSSSSVKWTFH